MAVGARRKGDFNVPTPMHADGTLLVATENNGTRAFRFDQLARIGAKPLAENTDLCPDAHSPIVIGTRVFGISGGMHCLDLSADLKTLWTSDDEAFGEYASLIGSPRRVLVATVNGELLLIDAEASDFRLINRVRLIADDSGVFSHPALVGTRLYVRGSNSVSCVDLADGAETDASSAAAPPPRPFPTTAN